jgi:hypothetical protein
MDLHPPADVLEKSGNTPPSKFTVTAGQEYAVRAMALWTYGMGVLIVDDTGRPNWKAARSVQCRRPAPSGGLGIRQERRRPVIALWGYPTLIRDPDHHDNLINRKISALEAFLRETGEPS